VAIKSSPGGQTLFLKLFRVADSSILPDAAPAAVDGVASPAGVAVLASVGTTVALGDVLISAVGVSSVASVGSAAATGGALTAISGVATVASVGTAVADGGATDATAVPAGLSVLASVGAAAENGTAVADPAGVELAASVGTAVADGGPADGLAAPLGVEMVASVGTATAFDADQVVVSSGGGGAWRGAHREPGEPRVFVTVFPAGVEATARVGRASATGDAVIAADGLRLVASVGEAAARVDVVVETVGAKSVTQMGTAAVFDVHVLPVRPYTPVETRSIVERVGTLAPSSSRPLADGVVSHPAPDAIDRAWADLQTEDDELVLLGVIA